MSVNLSPQHYSETNLVEDIKRLLMVTGFGPAAPEARNYRVRSDA